MRFPGGKFIQAKWIISHFPKHKSYVELFGGAASALLQKPRSTSEVYNDINDEIVCVFKVLRDKDQAAELERKLFLTPFSRTEYKLAYKPCNDPIELARRIIFRSFFGWGSDSVNRYTGGRSFRNTSMVTADREWSNHYKYIPCFVQRFRNVFIENRDYKDVINIFDSPETLFYADPPYLALTRTSSSIRYKNEFKKTEQHIELAEILKKVKGMVIISGYGSVLYDELYQDWRCVKNNAKTQTGSKRIECLWLSPNIKNNSLF